MCSYLHCAPLAFWVTLGDWVNENHDGALTMSKVFNQFLRFNLVLKFLQQACKVGWINIIITIMIITVSKERN